MHKAGDEIYNRIFYPFVKMKIRRVRVEPCLNYTWVFLYVGVSNSEFEGTASGLQKSILYQDGVEKHSLPNSNGISWLTAPKFVDDQA